MRWEEAATGVDLLKINSCLRQFWLCQKGTCRWAAISFISMKHFNQNHKAHNIQILTVAINWGSCRPPIRWSPGQRKTSALLSPDQSEIAPSRSFNILHLIIISYRFALLSRSVYISSNYSWRHLVIVEMEVNQHQDWVFPTCFCHLTLNCSSGCSTAPEKIPPDVAFSSGPSC